MQVYLFDRALCILVFPQWVCSVLEEAELKHFHSDMTGLRQLPKIQMRCRSPELPWQGIGEAGRGIAVVIGLTGFLSTLLCTMESKRRTEI